MSPRMPPAQQGQDGKQAPTGTAPTAVEALTSAWMLRHGAGVGAWPHGPGRPQHPSAPIPPLLPLISPYSHQPCKPCYEAALKSPKHYCPLDYEPARRPRGAPEMPYWTLSPRSAGDVPSPLCLHPTELARPSPAGGKGIQTRVSRCPCMPASLAMPLPHPKSSSTSPCLPYQAAFLGRTAEGEAEQRKYKQSRAATLGNRSMRAPSVRCYK